MKRFAVAFAAILALASSAMAAGTISFSLSQQLDAFGKPLANCNFYTIQAGTTATPQNTYKDAALTNPHPNPMRCDAAGRLDQFYLADGQIKIRLTDKNGLPQLVADNILVIGPSSGGGGGGSVDPTTILQTGDVKSRYGTGSVSGFVRMNGRTIGSASSGATERANADTQALFEYLCANDNNLVMTPARSGNCSNDFAANKVIALPDGRGRVLAALDDMGNSAAGRLTVSYFGTAATVLGAAGGLEKTTLARSDLPNTSVTVAITDPGHAHSTTTGQGGSVNSGGGAAFGYLVQNIGTSTGAAVTGISAAFNLNGNVTQTFPNVVQPTLLVTNYMKL